MEKEETEIRELWTKACAGICNGDWESYAACWSHTSKIQLIHTDRGEWLTGWEEIGAKYKKMLNSGISCNITRNQLRLNVSSSADMAWGTVDIIIHFNDNDKTRVHLWETVVFEKMEGNWKIVCGMASIPKNITSDY